jgi:hypothetical protein
MPENADRYLADVVVILDPLDDEQTRRVVSDLQSRGLQVDSVDNDNSVVEGTIEVARLKEIESAPSVRYVRKEFTYVAELPAEQQPGQTNAPPPSPSSPKSE